MNRTPLNIALAAAATLRLTRFVTTDTLGEWVLVRRLKDWGERHETLHLGRQPEEDHEPESWQGRLVTGLDCPFCVGFWIGAGVLASWVAVRDTRLEGPWRFVTGALALNYAVGHISARAD